MIGAVTLLADSGFGDHMDNWGAGWWILMMVLMVVFWGLVVLGLVWLVRSLATGHQPQHGTSAIEVLDSRLAHGEISPGEYRERRSIFEGDQGRSGSD